MKTLKFLRCVLVAAAVLFACSAAARADWPNLVTKWSQGPVNPAGWGFASCMNPSPMDYITADDFLCTMTGPIQEITFSGFNGPSTSFRVTFWTDVPRTPVDESHPGSLIYDRIIGPADPLDPLKIGWQQISDYDYRINLAQSDWFYQNGSPSNPVTYWLGIQGVASQFYWQAQDPSLSTWGDDAAFASEQIGIAPWSNWGWTTADDPEVYDGPFPAGWYNSADMVFTLNGTPEPATICLLGAGAVGMLLRRRRR
jgi:hypothetical protein